MEGTDEYHQKLQTKPQDEDNKLDSHIQTDIERWAKKDLPIEEPQQDNCLDVNSVPEEKVGGENERLIAFDDQREDNLAQMIQKLVLTVKPEYDSNLYTIFAFEAQDIEEYNREAIEPIIKRCKDKNFSVVFKELCPYLFDLLKRKESLEKCVEMLQDLSDMEDLNCQDILQTLEARDLIILLLESGSSKSMAKLGPLLTSQFYPLPIFYPIGSKDFKGNFACCAELLFQVKKPLILSLGTRAATQKGKSLLLSWLFSTRHPDTFSTEASFLHPASIDFYFKTPEIDNKYLIADAHGYVEDFKFLRMVFALQSSSQIIFLHITENDLCQDSGRLKKDFISDRCLQSKVPFLVLFRDYKNSDSNTLKEIDKCLKDSAQHAYLGIVPIPDIRSLKGNLLNKQRSQTRKNILEKVDALHSGNCSFSIAKVQRYFESKESLTAHPDSILTEELQQEKDHKFIIKGLTEAKESQPELTLHQKLFPFFSMNCHIIEKEKSISSMANELTEVVNGNNEEEKINKLSKQYVEAFNDIRILNQKKSAFSVPDLVKFFSDILVANDPARIFALSETLDQWKTPILDAIKKTHFEMTLKKDKSSKQKIKELESLMSDSDLTLDVFLEEIQDSYQIKNFNLLDYKGIKKYISSTLEQGAPVNLINGKTLKFGNDLLKEVFSELEHVYQDSFVVSIIGAQSSAKSTLLNYLFGCGFATSAGRCTKGLYMSLLKHPNGWYVVVIDTEGLLSAVARDHEFDNQMAVMAFSCSHIIIINHKGEITSTLRDLLEICVFAIKHLKLTDIKPKIMFALRDISDFSFEIQRDMLTTMKASLDEAAKKLDIDVNTIIDLSEEDIFLFPAAFLPTKAENQATIQEYNEFFSKKIVEMRSKIFKEIETEYKTKSIANLRSLYLQNEQLWNTLNKHGSDIMRARNFLEIELKESATEKSDEIFAVFRDIFVKNARILLEDTKEELFKNDLPEEEIHSRFYQLLQKEFISARDDAFKELNKNIFSLERFGAIFMYEKEFRERIEYNLGWQKQNFMGEWRAIGMQWSAIKVKEQFKKAFKHEIDRCLNEGGNSKTLESSLLRVSDQNKWRFKEQYKLKLNEISGNELGKLAAEIQNHYECAIRKIEDKNYRRINIPNLIRLLKAINSGYTKYHKESSWLKERFVPTHWRGSSDREESLNQIKSEFNKILNSILPILGTKSTEEIAKTVITACLAHVEWMQDKDFPLNTPDFLYSCLQEAMLQQYTKSYNEERLRMEKQYDELKEYIDKEEAYLQNLLKDSSAAYEQGVETGKKCFQGVLENLISQIGITMRSPLMIKIQDKFFSPVEANKLAFDQSFGRSNYENVIKYVLNPNRYIGEIFAKETTSLVNGTMEIMLNELINIFTQLIESSIKSAEKWQMKADPTKIDYVSSLTQYVKQDAILVRYFPKLYDFKISDLKRFISGFIQELSRLLKDSDIASQMRSLGRKNMFDSINKEYASLVGCQARCPMCGNKCILPDDSHSQHKTNRHLLMALDGTTYHKTNEPVLLMCFDPDHYQVTWYRGRKKYKNLDDMINKVYPDWRKEFPRGDQPNRLSEQIPQKYIECWLATKNVFLSYFGMSDNTPAEWYESTEIRGKPLSKDAVIEGYYPRTALR